MYMVLLVLDDIEHCAQVFDAWEAAGTVGITIMESTGLGRVRRSGGIQDDMPLLPSIISLLQSREERHRTLFSVVDDEAMVDKLIEATESVTGDLSQPHKGILFVLPVVRVVGLAKPKADHAS